MGYISNAVFTGLQILLLVVLYIVFNELNNVAGWYIAVLGCIGVLLATFSYTWLTAK